MAVDCYFPLLHRKHHDFHHVKYVCVVGHTIVFPAKIVKIYWLEGERLLRLVFICLRSFKRRGDRQPLENIKEDNHVTSLTSLTIIGHENLRAVGEAAVGLKGVTTAGVFPGLLQVDHCSYAIS